MRCLERALAWSPPEVRGNLLRNVINSSYVELPPGSLVVAEQPLLVLDPPTDRKTLLKTLGCDWCKVS